MSPETPGGDLGSTISLVHRLPQELIRKIFLACLPEFKEARLSALQVPLNVAHVCCYWRRVALSSAVLWSRFHHTHFDVFGTDCSRMLLFKDALDVWLHWSRNVPLDYCIILRLDQTNASKEVIKDVHIVAGQIMSTILACRARWRKISLQCIGISASHDFIVDVENMPLLEYLDLKFTTKSGSNKIRRVKVDVNISSSPQLKRLRLENFDSLRANKNAAQNLTECDFAFGDSTAALAADNCLLLLQLAPNLEMFYAHIYGTGKLITPARSRVPPLVLPNLRYLSIESSPTAIVIIGKLTLPALESLTLNANDCNGDPIAGEALLNLIRRSNPPLQTLDVRADFTSEDLLVASLRLLPSLQYLRVVSAAFWDKFWDALTVSLERGDTDVLCPNLETLELVNVLGLMNQEERVARMLVSRWDTKHLQVADLMHVDCEAERIQGVDSIQSCIAAGFWLTIDADFS